MSSKKSMYRIYLPLFMAIVFTTVLRVIPTTVFNQPISTDVWPLIRVSTTLVENQEARIWIDSYFDGYNNRWPGLPISVAVFSLVTGINVECVYRYLYMVAVVSTYTIALYLLTKTMSSSRHIAVVATLYCISIPSLLLFSSAVLKEVYAYPFLCIILLTIATSAKRGGNRFATCLMLLLFFTAITTVHHFATVMALEFIASTVVVILIHFLVEKPRRIHELWKGIELLAFSSAALATVFTLYYFIYGGHGFKYTIMAEDVALYVFYMLFVYVSYALVLQLKAGKTTTVLVTSAVIVTTMAIVLYSLAYGVSFEKLDIAPYIVPLALPLALFYFLPKEMDLSRALILGIALALSVNIMYIYFSRVELMSVFHRVLNYLPLMGSLLMAYTVSRSHSTMVKSLAFFSLSMAIVMGIIGVHNLVSGRDNTMFYWIYREPEVYSLNSIHTLATYKVKILGDAKVFYFMLCRRSVDTFAIIDYIYTGKSYKGSLAILYRDNFVKGYVTSLTIYRIDRMATHINQMNKVYDSGELLALLMV